MFCRWLMLWNHRTFLAESPSVGTRTSIYSSEQMSHLQNGVTILNLKVLGMVGAGCGWHGMLVIGRKNWGRGMWHLGEGEKCWRCFGNPSGALSMKGCLSVYLVWF